MQTIKNERLTCTISESGAELCSLKDNLGREYIWQGIAPYWASHAINLFPVCGRLYNQAYTYKGKEYSIGNHGFARKEIFTCVSNTGDKAIFRLTATGKTKEQYPFDFVLDIEYSLDGSRLNCLFTVKNSGSDEMIYAVGAHPGFNTENIEDFYIEFTGNPVKRVFSDACLDTGKTESYPMREGKFIDLKHGLFDNDGIFFQNVGESISLVSKAGEMVKIICPDANFWGIWHNPKTDAPFVCIEPWYGIPGKDGVVEDLTAKEYMVRLKPEEEKTYLYGIEIIK